ncbi:transposase [Streptomyces sp. NPDC006691]|uniref:helix-turn-helix domain-containing protein n=1 Tax=Streptomyces sp. NPDC006691 TaxID=3364757 RepID=UPI00369BD2AF
MVVLRARQSRDENEERVVRRLSRARKAPRDLVLRARMVELSWSGLRVPGIANELRCSPKTGRCWVHRFNRSGLDGLEDLGGRGRKRRITEAERSRIIGLVRQSPPGQLTMQADGEPAAADESGPPEWTLDALAAEAGRMGIEIGRSQVRRILLAEGVRWRRTRSWTRSNDPDFEGIPPPGS